MDVSGGLNPKPYQIRVKERVCPFLRHPQAPKPWRVECVHLQEVACDAQSPALFGSPLKVRAFVNLGRPLGYFIFSLIGFKRTIFRNIFQRV